VGRTGSEADGSKSPTGSSGKSGGESRKTGEAGGKDGSRDGGKADTGSGSGHADESDKFAGIGAEQVGASDGGSPLLPILIGILLLAAASVGVVLYRQRRGGDETGSSGAA